MKTRSYREIIKILKKHDTRFKSLITGLREVTG